MNPRLDRYGEPIEDDGNLASVVPIRQSVRQHIAELRRILAESRARRSADITVHMDMDEFFPGNEEDQQ
jgi:hypothetical protein